MTGPTLRDSMDSATKLGKIHPILLVEDDEAYARLVQVYLSNNDLLQCTITHCRELRHAQDFLRSGKSCAAILLDLSLPDSHGFETLERLLLESPKLNVIVMTGQSDKQLGVEAVQAGAQDFLIKGSFDAEELAKSLRYSIERSSILNRLEETQRLARIGHWECSPSEHFFFGSEELYRIIGRPYHEHLTCEELMSGQGAYRIFQQLQQESMATGKAQKDTWIELPDGSKRYVSALCTANELSNGGHTFYGIIQDITERKQTQELKKARNLAQHAAKVREQFIASISHEMRTPMNAILGMSNLLTQTRLDVEQLEYVEAIKQSSDILLGIINDILQMSTIQNDKLRFDHKPFAISQLLHNLMNVMKYKAREKGLSFELQQPESLPLSIKGDALRLNQILYNLVGNAIKFTKEGYVRLEVSVLKEEIHRIHLQFSVIDSGIGIAPNERRKIFETFARVPAGDQVYEGTGLGLSIAKNLVERQGGQMQVDSTLGEGSHFYFDLWFEKEQAFPAVSNSDRRSPALPDELAFKLLLVEDHKMNQMVARRTLEKKWPNVEVLVADNGKQALKLLGEHPVDLILMDIQMPILDGFATANIIRREMPPAIARTPILAMTAHANFQQSEQIELNGIDGVVLKPFEPQQLFAAIEKYLNTEDKTI